LFYPKSDTQTSKWTNEESFGRTVHFTNDFPEFTVDPVRKVVPAGAGGSGLW